jgi:hypothetical protein
VTVGPTAATRRRASSPWRPLKVARRSGNVTFGITGDYATTPDIEVLARGIEHGISELVAAAEQASDQWP